MRVVEGNRGGVEQRLGDHLVSGRDLVRSLTGRGETAACRGHEGSSWGRQKGGYRRPGEHPSVREQPTVARA
jgi:hypothetical protein